MAVSATAMSQSSSSKPTKNPPRENDDRDDNAELRAVIRQIMAEEWQAANTKAAGQPGKEHEPTRLALASSHMHAQQAANHISYIYLCVYVSALSWIAAMTGTGIIYHCC